MSDTQQCFDRERIEADLRRRHDWAKPYAPGRLSFTAIYSDPDIREKQDRLVTLNVDIGDVESSLQFVLSYEKKAHWNVYTSLCAFRSDLPRAKRPSGVDCIGVFGLIADCDTDKGRNQPIPIPATFEINSSPDNFHKAYIFSHAPITYRGALPAAVALKAATDTDPGSADAVHIWRIDGTLNWPNWRKVHERGRSREPFPVRITSADFDRRYVMDQLHLKLHAVISSWAQRKPKGHATAKGDGPRDAQALYASLKLATQTLIRAAPDAAMDRSAICLIIIGDMLKAGYSETEMGAIYALYPNGPFSHYRDQRGFLADVANIEQKAELSGQSAFASGQPPNALKREVRPSAPYPVEALGEVLEPAVQAIANTVQVPLAIAGSSVLATVSLIASAHANVALPSGLVRPISLWLMTVAESGDRKSTADQKAQNAFNWFEHQQLERYDRELQVYEDELEVWNAARKRALRGNRGGGAQALTAIGPKPLPPLHPTQRSGDPTLEGLVKHLADAHPSFGIFTSEGGQFIGGYGLSKDAKIRTVSGLSKFWDGDPVSRLRASDDKRIILVGRRLSIHCLAQPAIASAFINDPVLADQGFLSRFLFCAPESLAGQRPFRRPAPADTLALSKYDSRIRELLAVPPRMKEGTRNVLDPPEIRMTEEAERLWIAFHDDNERKLAKSAANAVVKAFANKLPEQAGRIAANLALVRGLTLRSADDLTFYGWPAIEADDMAGAIELARYHLDEVLRLVEVGEPDQGLEDAAALLEWMRKRAEKLLAEGEPPHIAHQLALAEVYQRGPRRFRKRTEAARSMTLLLNEGYVRQAAAPVFYGKYRYKDAYLLRTEPWD
jgi:hypothetical protein